MGVVYLNQCNTCNYNDITRYIKEEGMNKQLHKKRDINTTHELRCPEHNNIKTPSARYE